MKIAVLQFSAATLFLAAGVFAALGHRPWNALVSGLTAGLFCALGVFSLAHGGSSR